MAGSLPLIKTEDEFDELVANAPGPFLVDVGATWCGPCQRLTPVVEQFAADNAGRLPVFALDADDPRALSWRIGAGTLPRMLLIDRGAIQIEVPGFRDRAFLNDVFGTYPDLAIAEPDGRRIHERTPARTIELRQPAAGNVALLPIWGDTNEIDPRNTPTAPCKVDAAAGSYVRISVDADAIAELDQLEPGDVEEVFVAGLTVASLPHVLRLRGLRRIFAQGADITAEELAPLADLGLEGAQVFDTDHKPIAVPGIPNDHGFRIASSVQAARTAAGLAPLEQQPEPDSAVDVTGNMKRSDDGTVAATVFLKVAEGWYAYPAGSDEGVPLEIEITNGWTVGDDGWQPETDAPHLEGRVGITATLTGSGDDVRLQVRAQACNGETCLMPETTVLAVPVT